MNVIKIKSILNSQEFLAYLLGLTLSTLLIGYAPSSIALGIFIIFSLRFSLIHKNKIKIDFYLLLPMLVYIIFVLTLFWTVNQSQTKIGLERTIALFLVPFAFFIIPRVSLKNYKLVLNIYTVSNILFGLFFLICALINYNKTKSINAFTYHNLVSVLDLNAIYVSIIFSISLFYLMSKNKKNIKDKIAVLFFLVLLVLLSSKIMFVVLLMGVVAYLYCNKINILSTKKIIFLSVILVLVISLGSVSLMKRVLLEKDTKLNEVITKKEFGNVYPWTGSSIRLLQLRILKEQVEEESIFWKGFGLFASRENLKKRHLKFGTYSGFHNYNYHNQYAQIFSETGIFGLILLIITIIITFIKGLKAKNFLVIMFSVVIGAIFFTESFLWRQQGLFLFIVLYCLMLRTSFESKMD